MPKSSFVKSLPIGRQSFTDILERNELYVDKMKYLHELVKNGGVYFLSRPRSIISVDFYAIKPFNIGELKK